LFLSDLSRKEQFQQMETDLQNSDDRKFHVPPHIHNVPAKLEIENISHEQNTSSTDAVVQPVVQPVG